MKAFVLCALLSSAAWGLYTPGEFGEEVIAYRVPNGSIIVDGKLDDAWKVIGHELNGVETILFSDYDKIVLFGDAVLQNDDPRKHYNAPSQGSLKLMVAYDDQFVYLYFLVREAEIFNGSSVCPDGSVWKSDAIELWMDPNPFDERSYQTVFNRDARGGAFGTSGNSLQINKPVHPDDSRAFFADRKVDNRFSRRTEQEFKEHFPGFEMVSYNSENYAGSIGLEIRIGKWGALESRNPGDSVYINFGYNDYQGLRADCSENPVGYRWAKHFKKYTERIPGFRNDDSVHYDPTRSWDGWGKMELSLNYINPADAPADLPCELDVDCPTISIRPWRTPGGLAAFKQRLHLLPTGRTGGWDFSGRNVSVHGSSASGIYLSNQPQEP